MSKLTHSDLIELGQLLGYKLLPQGLCHGFGCMLMQAILSQDEDNFWARLQLIEKYNGDFSSLLEKIEQVKVKVRNREELNEEEFQLIEIPAFYEGVELYLRPDAHLEVFNESKLGQKDIEKVYAFVKSNKLEHKDISIVLSKSYFFNKSTLKDYIDDLTEIMNKKPELPIFMNNPRHIVALKYNKKNQEKPWSYVDTNFELFPENLNYYSELTKEELVNSLYLSLSEDWGFLDYSLFETTIIAERDHNINEYITDLEILLVRKDPEINKVNQNGETPLYIACKSGHGALVTQLIGQEGIEINKACKDGSTPLYIACQNGHSFIVQALLAQPDIEINITPKTGFTPLDIACCNGHENIVYHLLKTNKIDVNRTSSGKNTPLLLACISLQTLGKNHIFRMLLAHKSSLIYKNDHGHTALDIAFIQKNNTAIEEILVHLKTSNLSLTEVMSLETREETIRWAINNSDLSLLTNLVRIKLLELSKNRFLSNNSADYSDWDLKKVIELGANGADTNAKTLCIELGWLTKEGSQTNVPKFIFEDEIKQKKSFFCEF